LDHEWLASWLVIVIANELKSWLGSARYNNEPSRASHEPSELMSFEFFIKPYLEYAMFRFKILELEQLPYM
jgi:hypothetical protein